MVGASEPGGRPDWLLPAEAARQRRCPLLVRLPRRRPDRSPADRPLPRAGDSRVGPRRARVRPGPSTPVTATIAAINRMPKTVHLRALGSLLPALAVLCCQAACDGAGKPAEPRPLRWAADAERCSSRTPTTRGSSASRSIWLGRLPGGWAEQSSGCIRPIGFWPAWTATTSISP